MIGPLSPRVMFVDGEPVELWTASQPSFSCSPEEIRGYMDRERWDLVFNALCHLTGMVEEGSA